MAGIEEITEKTIKMSENWCRLAVCTNFHIKKALVAVLHNDIKNTTITAIPSDPAQLFQFMVNNKNTLDKHLQRKIIKQDQYEALLTHEKTVYSDKLDITLVRYLICTFNHISNQDGTWKQPKDADHSIAAAVFRATGIRNSIAH